ncbi:MAG: signal peptidase I [Nocardioides sp.]|uniref:signal peptidase I n=1 Tax=Nocardioides sp. TaxID=35761 RepID=UPI0039E2A109
MTSTDRDPAVEAEPPEDGDDPAGSRSSSEPAASENRRKPRLSLLQETVILVVLAVVAAVIVKSFFVQAFYIPSESMEPGLQGGSAVKTDDRVIVEKPSYWFGGPSRGDIVVFSDSKGWLDASEETTASNPLTKAMAAIGLYPQGGHLVKRVIGVAGDTISCCDIRGRIRVNGVALNEQDYARPASYACGEASEPGTCYGPMPGTKHWSVGPVPEGDMFVMGDNRANSSDSSAHLCTSAETDCAKSPYVPVDDVVGKVVALAWPLDRATIIHRPSTFADVPDR